ncbi:MAG: alcohol dehydrogenase catalytic domain-containing protein [Chloroflexi bacterium]|jgi:L-iditol 2-dehydrogenase|nr:alcohol dehydrogenase catalytic domain-containing protein [Anaerolineaceae bacterium]NMB90097.1 alcohol dehydrogenase catalytic domain-containing protein [Chloroflexota bacterium]
MKGVVAGDPGQVKFVEFPEPVAGEGDLIVEMRACGVCTTDIKLVQKGSRDMQYALGHEMVGRVLQAPAQSAWEVGQRVSLAPYLPCGKCYYCQKGQYTLCSQLFTVYCAPGGLAERVHVPAEMAARGTLAVPPELSDELATLAEPLGCVLKGLADSQLQPGDALLVIGDGPMGQLAAAAGKCLGAGPVMMVGMTPHRLAVAGRYYADLTLHVGEGKVQQSVLEATDGRGADVVMVAVSSAEALGIGLDCVRPGGQVNMFAGVPEDTLVQFDVRKIHYQQFHLTGSFGTAPAYMRQALELLQAKQVDFSPIISARFPFSRAADAIGHMRNYDGLKAVVLFP